VLDLRILRIMNLTNLGGCNSESDFFRRHCRSVIKVIKLFCGHCVIHEEEGRQHNTRHNHNQLNNKRCESQHNVPEWVVLLCWVSLYRVSFMLRLHFYFYVECWLLGWSQSYQKWYLFSFLSSRLFHCRKCFIPLV